MTDLLREADPARGLETDKARLRSAIADRTAGTPRLVTTTILSRHRWLPALAGFMIIMSAIAIPTWLEGGRREGLANRSDGIIDLPGIDMVVPLASGGVQTGVVYADRIWIATALANELQEISIDSGQVVNRYEIDGHIEGVLAGSGYLWLLSYDNSGEILRFDPERGEVDRVIPIGGPPWSAAWFDAALWVSTDQSEVIEISPTGDIESRQPGDVKGTGLGYLWINDPATGLIVSLSVDGVVGDVTIPTDGEISPTGTGISRVAEAGGYLWLSDSGPTSAAVVRFDPMTGVLDPLPVAIGAWALTEFDGYLWMTSRFDHTLLRVNPVTGELHTYPMPGKPGQILIADSALWVTLYQPGAILKLDTNAALIETSPTVVGGGVNGHFLVCTQGEPTTPAAPTVILEPESWAGRGSMALVQALLSHEGYRVCSDGYLERQPDPTERATDLTNALNSEGIGGPYVLAAFGDGIHTARLFADRRSDVVGVILVDPTPLGFEMFYTEMFGQADIDAGHPTWLDISGDVSDDLTTFGSVPLIVIGQDPEATFGSDRFRDFAGAANARALGEYWQDGLAFYRGLSTNSRTVTARGNGMTGILWNDPDLVVRQILAILDGVHAP